ncbi:MAG: hypothetical protein HC893_11845 [Chloroflexaceae bacterium]|nr:hypothetical protein [Chloroflexaceae bacterium]NJO04853.1 hypothetical protein [Chloroflexaceae bacterium]
MNHLLTCMGEILIDFLPIEEHGTTLGFRMHPGGAPFNVAVGLARLGMPVAFLSKMADDFSGAICGAILSSKGCAPTLSCSNSAA